jgi:hypothetical protein
MTSAMDDHLIDIMVRKVFTLQHWTLFGKKNNMAKAGDNPITRIYSLKTLN